MKKKIIAICLCVALVAVGIVGATLAYFTDKDQLNNTFAIGNVDIDLYELTDAYPEMIFQKELKYSDIMPGDVLSKKPFIENTGNYDAYVRVLVQINNHVQRNDAIDAVYEGMDMTHEQVQAKYNYIFEGWGINHIKYDDGIANYNNGIRGSMAQRAENPATGVTLYGIDSVRCTSVGADYQWEAWNLFKTDEEKAQNAIQSMSMADAKAGKGYYGNALNDNSNMYVFYLKMAPGAKYQLFNGLNVPADFTGDQLKMFDGLKIDIYADAIQVDNFTDTIDEATGAVTTSADVNAFNALEAAHPLGWWNTAE